MAQDGSCQKWPKKKEYQYRRQIAAWIPSSFSMSTLGGEQMAHNVLTSCRGCLHIPKRWGGKNKNNSSIEAAGNWSLGRMLRQKHWQSRWWDSRPLGRRTKGYTMRYINKRGYWAPHHMGQGRWKPLTGKSVLLWKSGHDRGGVPPGQKKIYGEPLHLVCGPAARLNSIARPKEGTRTHMTRHSVKPGRHTEVCYRLPTF